MNPNDPKIIPSVSTPVQPHQPAANPTPPTQSYPPAADQPVQTARPEQPTASQPQDPAASSAHPAGLSQPSITPEDPMAYLNAIAPKPQKNRFLSGKMLVVIVGAAIVLTLVVILGVVLNNARQATLAEATSLGTRLNNIQSIITYGQNNPVENANTLKTAAEINLISLSHQKTLSEFYTLSDPDAEATTVNESINSTLDSAKARGNLNQAYIKALREQLTAAASQTKVLYSSARTDAQKNALSQAYDDFQELTDRLPEATD